MLYNTTDRLNKVKFELIEIQGLIECASEDIRIEQYEREYENNFFTQTFSKNSQFVLHFLVSLAR